MGIAFQGSWQEPMWWAGPDPTELPAASVMRLGRSRAELLIRKERAVKAAAASDLATELELECLARWLHAGRHRAALSLLAQYTKEAGRPDVVGRLKRAKEIR